MKITSDDIHWFEPAFAAWQCDDMEGVLDGLENALDYFMPSNDAHLAALAQNTQGKGEAISIEAVGVVVNDAKGDLLINWLTEGGIHGVGNGAVLLCAERDITDEDGQAEVYLHAQRAKVPDARTVLRDLERSIGGNASGAGIDNDKRPTDYKAGMVKAYGHCLEMVRKRLAAAPSQPAQGDPLDTAVGWLDMCKGSVADVVDRITTQPKDADQTAPNKEGA